MSRIHINFLSILLCGFTWLFVSCSPSTATSLLVDPRETDVFPTLLPSPSDTTSPTATSVPPTPSPTSTITFTPQPSLTPTVTPLLTRIVDQAGIPMVLVPAGSFIMGRDDRAGIERPAHTVILDDFYIDQFEVTNEWFAAFLNQMGNQFEGLANWIEANDVDLHVHEFGGVWQVDSGYEDYPMNEMTWYGARAFCEWRGAHLPTEAQWEKAARGTDERTYPWGEEISCELANYAGCVYAAVPVDSYPEGLSPYGAYNMAGNMMEWVADRYQENYYATSPAENPSGPETGDFRIIRGGSWINNSGNLRTTHRYPKLPVLTYTSVGFRCARDLSP